MLLMEQLDSSKVLPRYKNWLLKIAWEYSSNLSEVQDLAQEGYIAMWKALQTFDESKNIKLSTHLMNKARWRISEVRARGTYTGMPSRAGKRHTAGTEANKNTEQSVDMSESMFDIEISDNIDSILLAYHHGEIMEAINSLPVQQRKRVYDRFWKNDYDAKNSAWWFGKRIGARDRLKERLGHLESILDRV